MRPARTLDEWGLQNFCVLIPAFNESVHIGEVVREVRSLGLNVLVVDDGSEDDTAAVAEAAGGEVVRLEQNGGKGAALQYGFERISDEGYDAVVTMDADGQHRAEDALRFCEIYNRTGIPVLIGNRMGSCGDMPLIRRFTNFVMSFLLSQRMTQVIPDTQNGFRLYQTDVIAMVGVHSGGFAAESEVLLRVDDLGIRMGSVPIPSSYGTESSAIRPLIDAVAFVRMLRTYEKMRRSNR